MATRIPTRAQDDAEAVTDLLGVLWRRVHHETMRRISSPGITPARLRALRFVARGEEPVRMGELAEKLGIVPRSATTLVDELTEAGWVHRLPDAGDRRVTLVEATPAGRRILERANRIRREVAAEMLSSLDQSELGKLRSLLSAAVDA